MTEFTETAAARAAGLTAQHPFAAVLDGRADIMAMTERAHDAALSPDDPGGLSLALRTALACRMARLNRAVSLAAHFDGLIAEAEATDAVERFADPSYVGNENARDTAIIRYVDVVTKDTKAATAEEIEALAAAGVSENDIVRLAELVAFVNYQARLAIGLALLGAQS